MFGAKRKELENNLTKDEDSYFSMKFQTMQEEDELKKEKKSKLKSHQIFPDFSLII